MDLGMKGFRNCELIMSINDYINSEYRANYDFLRDHQYSECPVYHL